jgi:hypothetical protein
MKSNPENRDKTRFEHESPITLENIDPGGLRGARMFNFSDFGLYFEADFLLQPDTEIRIGISKSPFALEANKYERFRGIVKWRQTLKKSSFYYGYGVELLENLSGEGDWKPDLGLRKHPRKPCSVPLKYETKSLLYQGIAENISRGGIFIKSKNNVAMGQRIKLSIPVRKKGKIAKIIGQVVWATHSGFGIKFQRSD